MTDPTTKTPTARHLRAIRNAGLSADEAIGWHGNTIMFRWPHGNDLIALVNEHGSVTYCPEVMLETHLRGIPA